MPICESQAQIRQNLDQGIAEKERRKREERARKFKAMSPGDPNDFDIPSNDQVGFIMSNADERWIFGGVRSSKTESAVEDANMFLTGNHPVRSEHQMPPVKVRFVGPKWRDNVKGVLVQKFKEVVRRADLRGDSWRTAWSETDHKLHYKDGGFVQFKSGEEDPDTYDGIDLDAAYHDEPLPRWVYDKNKARLADRNGYFVGTMTPELGVTWEKDHIENPSPDFSVKHWFFDIRGNYYLNPEGVRKYLASIRDKGLLETKRSGKFMTLQGMVIPQWNPDIHYIADRPFKPGTAKVFCGDFHLRTPSAVMWCAWEPRKDNHRPLLIVYRISKQMMNVDEWKSFIKAQTIGDGKILQWWGDESERDEESDTNIYGRKSILGELRNGENKLPIMKVGKPPGSFKMGILRLREMMSPDPITMQPDIVIFKSCQYNPEWIDGEAHGDLGWEIQQYRFRKKTAVDEEINREAVVTKHDHLISDLRYIASAGSPIGEEAVAKRVLPKRRQPNPVTGYV